MKLWYQCERCGQMYENPSEAIVCEETGPQPKFQVGEEVNLYLGPGSQGETLEPVVIEAIVIPEGGPISYRLSGDWGIWGEITLRKREPTGP